MYWNRGGGKVHCYEVISGGRERVKQVTVKEVLRKASEIILRNPKYIYTALTKVFVPHKLHLLQICHLWTNYKVGSNDGD